MTIVDAIRSRNLAELQKAVAADPEKARAARFVVEAGRVAWQQGLAILKRNGADLNASFRGYRAIHSLIQEDPHGASEVPSPKRVSALVWLLKNGADPEQLGAWPAARAILVAAFAGEPAYVNALTEAGARLDGFTAAGFGDLAAVKRTLSRQPDFAAARDAGGLTPLQCCCASRMGRSNPAVARNLLSIAGLLLDHGADPNTLTSSWAHQVDAIYFAASSGQASAFELLLQRGAIPSRALSCTVWKKDLALAEMALRFGAKPDEAIEDGRPVLNELIRWGQVTPALWLLKIGASPNIADSRGWTAVHQAASRGNQRLLSAVLESGGDPTVKNRDGHTPADLARIMKKPTPQKKSWVDSGSGSLPSE